MRQFPAADQHHGTEAGHERAPGSRRVGSRVSDHRLRQASEVSQPTPADGDQIHASFRGGHLLLQNQAESVKTIAKYMKINDMEAVGATYDYSRPRSCRKNRILPSKASRR